MISSLISESNSLFEPKGRLHKRRQLFETYTSDESYSQINQYLRSPHIYNDPNVAHENKNKIAETALKLSKVLKRPYIPRLKTHQGRKFLYFYRGFKNEKLLADHLKKKTLMIDGGITSVTYDKRIMKHFHVPTCCMLYIRVPVETPMLYLGNLSKFDEKEFILPPGCIFEVERKEQSRSTNVTRYRLILIGFGQSL